ncbi:ankyrin repeat and SOCS box protein 13 [Strongylocentrotus purpuratus]|uniref:SOCS box domain-containing protein n=1 Tax=Strongylocentrotus purpuratus TaxID=7668 RepID=A0A7M7HMV7_STRPU|nr:ankyrin repeat and SOCS box protein 13 [Strongylocentrotus purpuratus]XP_030829412.1 ankyrin repeat and SOCS box protein 13 [Strongylocentrotus purpuratus]
MSAALLDRYTGDAFMGQDRTDLHAAAFQGQLMTLYGLIRRGADVNKCTSDRVSPLHDACSRGYLYCAEMLVKHGADVNAGNIDGATPLCEACCIGNVEIVQFLLSKGAIPNPPMARTGPLNEAASRGHTKCVEEMIKAGSNLEASDLHYGTPLHAACHMGSTETARVILQAGGNVNAIMNHTSPLHVAAGVKNPDLVDVLLEYGANVYALNNQSRTPRDLIHATDTTTRKILDFEMGNPRMLAELCRWRIRRLLGPKRLEQVIKLGLPKIMVNYVLFR